MRSPEMSVETPAAPPVLLVLSSALGLWAVIIVATATLWPRHPVAPQAMPIAAPQTANEARVIKMARVTHVSPVTSKANEAIQGGEGNEKEIVIGVAHLCHQLDLLIQLNKRTQMRNGAAGTAARGCANLTLHRLDRGGIAAFLFNARTRARPCPSP